MNSRIVHILGMRRSGTTWIAKLFDSHPDTLYRHEPDSSLELPDWPYYPDVKSDSFDVEQYENFIAAAARASKAHISAKMPIFPKSYLNTIRFQLLRISALSSKLCRRILGSAHNVLDVSPYLPAEGTLVWKSVEAPCRTGLFAKYPDDSKVIYVIRHPCGYLNSYVRGQDSGKMPRTTDDFYDREMWQRRLQATSSLRYGLDEAMVDKWNRKERIVWEWLIDNEKVLADIDETNNVFIANYDALCADPLAGTKKMFEYADLEWAQQTMNFLDQGRAKKNDTYFGVYKDPMVAASAWRTQLSSDDIDLVNDIVSGTPAGNLFI